MGVQLARQKPKRLWLSALYRLYGLPWASKQHKLKVALNLEWFFDRMAHELSHMQYSVAEHPLRVASFEFVERHLKPEMRVLDLGCGNGVLTAFMAERCKAVTGIELNAANAAAARTRTQAQPNVTIVEQEARAFLENSDETYDVLFLSHILEHLDAPAEFLASVLPYVQEVYVELPDFEKTPLNAYRKRQGMSLVYTDDDHVTEFDRHELRSLLEQSGLQIVEADYRYGHQFYWCRKQPQA